MTTIDEMTWAAAGVPEAPGYERIEVRVARRWRAETREGYVCDAPVQVAGSRYTTDACRTEAPWTDGWNWRCNEHVPLMDGTLGVSPGAIVIPPPPPLEYPVTITPDLDIWDRDGELPLSRDYTGVRCLRVYDELTGIEHSIRQPNFPAFLKLIDRVGFQLVAVDNRTVYVRPKGILTNQREVTTRYQTRKQFRSQLAAFQTMSARWEALKNVRPQYLDENLCRILADEVRTWPEVMAAEGHPVSRKAPGPLGSSDRGPHGNPPPLPLPTC